MVRLEEMKAELEQVRFARLQEAVNHASDCLAAISVDPFVEPELESPHECDESSIERDGQDTSVEQLDAGVARMANADAMATVFSCHAAAVSAALHVARSKHQKLPRSEIGKPKTNSGALVVLCSEQSGHLVSSSLTELESTGIVLTRPVDTSNTGTVIAEIDSDTPPDIVYFEIVDAASQVLSAYPLLYQVFKGVTILGIQRYNPCNITSQRQISCPHQYNPLPSYNPYSTLRLPSLIQPS